VTSAPTTSRSAKTAKPAISGKLVLSVLIFAVGLWFILANTESARIHLFLVTVSSPMWLVLAITFGGGWLCGWLFTNRRHKKTQ
jgi:uncharacterized integral membrane protein